MISWGPFVVVEAAHNISGLRHFHCDYQYSTLGSYLGFSLKASVHGSARKNSTCPVFCGKWWKLRQRMTGLAISADIRPATRTNFRAVGFTLTNLQEQKNCRKHRVQTFCDGLVDCLMTNLVQQVSSKLVPDRDSLIHQACDVAGCIPRHGATWRWYVCRCFADYRDCCSAEMESRPLSFGIAVAARNWRAQVLK